MATHSFDGVDIALESPDIDTPEDKIALTTLLEVDIVFFSFLNIYKNVKAK